jgi:hypothetical protein
MSGVAVAWLSLGKQGIPNHSPEMKDSPSPSFIKKMAERDSRGED